MSYKISKELFEAVYNEDYLLRIEVGTYSIVAYLTDGAEFTENIDTFFFDCKKWAFENNFVLSSQLTNYFDVTNDTVRILGYCYIENINTSPNFYSYSEQQAVFDACQWILDNKDKNDINN